MKYKIAAIVELPINSTLPAVAGDKNILLVRTDDGIYALENSCPHQSRPMDTAVVKNGSLKCIYHGVKINPSNGEIIDSAGYLGLPPVKTYPLEETEGQIILNIPYFPS